MGNTNGVNRRDVLKKAGIVTGLTLTGSGSASGDSSNQVGNNRRDPIEHKYLEKDNIKAAVRLHAGGLLRELNKRDLLRYSSIKDLPLENLDEEVTHVPPKETDRKVGVTSVPMEEGRTALLMISEDTPTNAIGIYVQPEAEKAYAIIYPKDDPSARYKINYSSGELTVQEDTCGSKKECDTGNWCSGGCDDGLGCGYYQTTYYDCYYCTNPYGNGGCCCDEVGTGCADGNECYCCYDNCVGC